MSFGLRQARDAVLATDVTALPVSGAGLESGAGIRVPAAGPRVPFASSPERDFLMLCRTQPSVKAVVWRELQLAFFDQLLRTNRQYTPAFVVDYTVGATAHTAIVDVIPRSELWRSRRRLRANLAAARQWAAREAATSFVVVTDEAMGQGAWLANAKLLSPFLDRPYDLAMVEVVTRAVGVSGAQISRVLEVGRQQGLNQQELLAAIYRMAATGELQLDLGFPITGGTWVRCVGSQD